MRSTAITVGWFVGHDREPCKKAEPIEMPFGLWTAVGSRHPVLGGGPDLLREGAISGACPAPL